MHRKCVPPGPLLSFVGPGNEAIIAYTIIGHTYTSKSTDYCPNCGSYMYINTQ